jgi:hypothetical protein
MSVSYRQNELDGQTNLLQNIPLPSRQATRPSFAVTRWGIN